MKKKLIIVFFIVFIFLIKTNVYAYLDPGTGSYLLQIIIAGIASFFLGIKIFWKRIKDFLKKLFKKKKR